MDANSSTQRGMSVKTAVALARAVAMSFRWDKTRIGDVTVASLLGRVQQALEAPCDSPAVIPFPSGVGLRVVYHWESPGDDDWQLVFGEVDRRESEVWFDAGEMTPDQLELISGGRLGHIYIETGPRAGYNLHWEASIGRVELGPLTDGSMFGFLFQPLMPVVVPMEMSAPASVAEVFQHLERMEAEDAAAVAAEAEHEQKHLLLRPREGESFDFTAEPLFGWCRAKGTFTTGGLVVEWVQAWWGLTDLLDADLCELLATREDDGGWCYLDELFICLAHRARAGRAAEASWLRPDHLGPEGLLRLLRNLDRAGLIRLETAELAEGLIPVVN